MEQLSLIMIAKGLRTFVFGMVSVMTPIYLAILGYSPVLVGSALFVIVSGNVFSNVLLTWYGNVFKRKNFLLVFSALMSISGFLLFFSSNLLLIFPALFIGNISTTGTEAGPFQSIETGVLPSLAGKAKSNRSFGTYNLIGYAMSSIGALASSFPSYFKLSPFAFRSVYLLYALVGLVLFLIYLNLKNIEATIRKKGLQHLRETAKKDVTKLSFLFSLDAFGGGFVTQSILSYWFFYTYHVSLKNLGFIFMFVNIITAISIYGASLIAERIGNLHTMVITHLLSNVFLIIIPFAGNVAGSLAFLFLRQSVSQMDVPTRQAFMAQIFDENERVTANAITNTFRSLSSLPGSPVVGLALAEGLLYVPFAVGGGSKLIYDVSVYFSYRKRVK
jgi:predicted MFS family arabinose efflux permease